MTGSPCVTEKPSLGIAALSEKALALIRWQPVQWQAMVIKAGAAIRIRTWPQRQPPSPEIVFSGISDPHLRREICRYTGPVMAAIPRLDRPMTR
jgi:hypothetical protein